MVNKDGYKMVSRRNTMKKLLSVELRGTAQEITETFSQLPLSGKLSNISGQDDFILMAGVNWCEKGVRLPALRMIKINELIIDSFKKGSRQHEMGDKLLPKRSIQILKVMLLCIQPVKTGELMTYMKFGSKDKLRELYLIPLRKEGLIEPLIKDKINSPEQRFVLTERGRLFLGGFEI